MSSSAFFFARCRNTLSRKRCSFCLILLFACACGGVGGGAGSDTSSLTTMRRTRSLDVCYVLYPPMVSRDARTQELSGHMIETLERIVTPLGVQPRYHEQAWGTAALGLQSGVCDLIVSGFFIKISRAFAVSFTRPLLYLGDAALVRKGEQRFKSIHEANDPSVTIAVATGESGHEYAKQHLPLANIHNIDVEGGDLSRIFLEVSSGRADLALADAWSVSRFDQVNAETESRFTDKSFNMNAVAWATRHEDQSLLRFIENALTVLEVNGTLKKLEAEYEAHWLHEQKTFALHKD